MESEQLFRLGSNDQPWTQEQIDAFMERMEEEMFGGDVRRGGSPGEIVRIVRRDADGNLTEYAKKDGQWREV